VDIDIYGWSLHLYYLRDLMLAYLLAIPVALDREHDGRSAGLRTFPLVAMGCCAFLVVGRDIVGDNPDALARLLYGLMAGIGFIGGGAIVKQGGIAFGTATAAAIWCTGAIGAAVAFQRYEVAMLVAGVNFLTLLIFKPLKQLIPNKHERDKKADNRGAG
jgi:putative Mg2+ transporter-C (MgtC) family protein